MAHMIKPKCRYCGTRVPHFGAICSDCTGTDDPALLRDEWEATRLLTRHNHDA